MATKAEQARQQQARHGLGPKALRRAKAKKTRAEKFAEPHRNERAARKAAYPFEAPPKTGAVSRKSSRAGGNRMKPDSNLNLREERQKGSPTSRFRKAYARATRVRGKPA